MPDWKVTVGTIDTDWEGLMRLVAEKADIIIEGGMGPNTKPREKFRELGFDGPYVDLDFQNRTYVGDWSMESDETWQKYRKNNYDLHGDCRKGPVFREIIEKFKPEYVVFVTRGALTNVILEDVMELPLKRLEYHDSSLGWLPYEYMVKTYTDSCDAQLHIKPAGATRISAVPLEEEEIEVPEVEGIRFYPGKLGSTYNLHGFKKFLMWSDRYGWDFQAPGKGGDVLFMTKTKI